MLRFLIFSFAFFAIFNPNQSAHAYLDPGTGSIMLQMLLGLLAGAAVVGRIYWDRLKAFFGFGRNTEDKNPPDLDS